MMITPFLSIFMLSIIGLRLLAGMAGRLSVSRGIPIHCQTEPEGWLPEPYGEIAKIMKMHRASA